VVYKNLIPNLKCNINFQGKKSPIISRILFPSKIREAKISQRKSLSQSLEYFFPTLIFFVGLGVVKTHQSIAKFKAMKSKFLYWELPGSKN